MSAGRILNERFGVILRTSQRNNMRKRGCAVLLFVVVTATAFGQTAFEGEITGTITDTGAAVLPGVRITISSGDERREAITDGDGRFVLGMLKLGTYRVAADLVGFASESGTITLSAATRRAHIAWSLKVGCISEGIRVILSPRDAAPRVAAIVHIRVKSDDGPLLWSARPECPGSVVRSYAVEVLGAVSRGNRKDNGRATQQMFLELRDRCLQPGGEYLALLWPGWRAADQLVFPIEAGRISSSAGDALSGMRVEKALKTLGEWSRQRPR
jgi:hypothetical protein